MKMEKWYFMLFPGHLVCMMMPEENSCLGRSYYYKRKSGCTLQAIEAAGGAIQASGAASNQSLDNKKKKMELALVISFYVMT